MPDYVRDQTGVVHVMSPGAGNEFTFCSRPTDGDTSCGGFEPEPCEGPSNCEGCSLAVWELRQAIKGIRWSRAMKPSRQNEGG